MYSQVIFFLESIQIWMKSLNKKLVYLNFQRFSTHLTGFLPLETVVFFEFVLSRYFAL